ncbi:hypothetical protein GCM10011425_20950 [Mucilaginibacter galii]|uniref:MBG domain-containing protein n=1 Tax=Mucilaginibacter galii TaxID=2005073 RepID=A0A917N1H8_9SPHI|nr:hypothetical protein GCM10011425_20950 [Mucilaginibacter galii]
MLATATHVSAAKHIDKTARSSVYAADQTITFNPVAPHTYGDADFTVTATASSGLPVEYRSSNMAIATVNTNTGLVHIISTGTFAITASQPGDANYNAANRVSQLVTINKADLTVNVNSQTRSYGVNNIAFTIIYSGFKNNDTQTKLTVRPTVSTTANVRSDVGTYPITISAASSNFYNFIYDAGTVTVTPAPLTITAGNKIKAYGAANPALTLTYSGFKNNETAAVLTTQATLSTPVDVNTAPGTYAISVSGATASNYSISFIDGVFTVSRGTLRVAAATKTKVYGAGSPELTYTVTGYVLGQTSSVFTSPVTISTTATAASPVGTYPIDATGGSADNYNIIYVPGALNINKAQLKIAAASMSKLYGEANSALTYTYTGFVLNDTEADLTAPPVITTTAQTNSPVGNYPITINGASSNNYTIIYIAGRLTINKAPLRIIADAKTKTYKSANPALTYTYDGFVNNDTESSLTTAPIIATTATTTSLPGVYPITVKSATATNYTITYVNSALTVAKADLIIKANDITRSYGTTIPAFSFTYTGFVNNETEANLQRKPTASASVTARSEAGTYTITPSGAASPNYNIIYQTGTLTIEKRTLTVTAVNKTKTYGAANPAFTLTYSGLVNGDRAPAILTGTPDVTTQASTASLPGTYAIEVSGNVTADNYAIVYVNGEIAVQKAILRVTAVSKNKAYGQPNPAFTYTYSGFVNGDNASALTNEPETPVTTANASSPAGFYPITVTGGTADNYTFQYIAGRLTINKVTLTANINAKTKVYGQPNPALTATYTGFVNGDAPASITTEPTFTTVDANSPVGTYAITGTGGVANNYTFRIVNSTLTITRASLNITVNDATRGYGVANPPFSLAYNGLVNGDDASTAFTTAPTITTSATITSQQGTYPVTASGAVSSNYTLTYVPGTLTITKAQLFVKADDKTKTYGDANPALTLSYSGFLNGDNQSVITTAPVANVNANAGSGAGNYTITPSGGSTLNNSYDLVYQTGTLTITKAPLNIAAQNASRVYGAANPVFAPVYTGFVNSETSVVLIAQPVANTTATTNSSVGSYPVNFSGATAANYNISYTPATLTITRGTLTITANNKTRMYGAANPVFEFTYSGFAAGDSQANLTTAPAATTPATTTSAVGNYAIIPSGAVSNNYTIVYNNGTLTVDKAQLTVTADNQSKIYGAVNPSLTVRYNGFVNGEMPAVLSTAATATTSANAASGVGTYAIVPAGAAASNYNFIYANGVLSVSRAQLNVIAENKTKVYGTTNPALSYTINGFVNGDNATVITTPPVGTTSATTNSGVGTYPINFAGATAANYALSYTPATLTVTPAVLTITANNQTRTFGQANPAFTLTYVGFVNGDGAANLTTQPSASTTATTASPAGTYPIVPGGGVSANYSFTYVNGTLTVTSTTATINFALLPAKTVGDADFAPGATNSVNEPLAYTSSNQAVATIVNGNIHIVGAGTTVITAAFPAGSNYNQNAPVSQLFVVNKASQVITFNAIPAITRGESYTIPAATSSSGLPVILEVKDATVASVRGLVINGLQVGTTTIRAFQPGNDNYNAATTVVQTIQVINNAGKADLQVHLALSPNGDGENDVFVIEGIKDHPDNQVTVVNRNGVKIYEIKGYDNTSKVFDGHSNITGALQQPGTYFYLIQYHVNGEGKRLTGAFVIKY